MKKILLLLLLLLLMFSLILISCGSRKKETFKDSKETKIENNTNLQQSTSLQNNTEAVTDVKNFLLNKGLRISSNGLPYQFQYGDLIFSGSADVEFSEKKEETVFHHQYLNHITYQTKTTYKTKTFFRTVQNIKKANVQREGISFGSLVWIIITSFLGGAAIGIFLWIYIKKYIPVWFKKKSLNN